MYFLIITYFFVSIYLLTCNGHMCTITTLQADCFNKTLQTIPQDIQPTIQVLDLRFNKLSSLQDNVFRNYRGLRILLLSNNMLETIQKNAFLGLDKLQNLSMSNNILDINKVYSRTLLRPLRALKYLDISRNTPTTKSSPIQYPFFGDLKNLHSLSIDLISRPKFDKCGFERLIYLKRVVFDYCYTEHFSSETFSYLPKFLKEIYFKRCFTIRKIDYDALKHFQELKTLSIFDSNMDLTSAMRLLSPYEGKTMDTVEFTRVNPGFEFPIRTPNAVTVTSKMIKYLQTICLKTLVLAENGIVEIEPDCLDSHSNLHCFQEMILTGNRFSFLKGFNLRDFFTIGQKLTNLTSFDLSYNPVSYREIQYEPRLLRQKSFLGVNDIASTEFNPTAHFRNETTYIKLPPRLKKLRIRYYRTNEELGQKLVLLNASSLEYLVVSHFCEENFPQIFLDGQVNIQHIDFSGIYNWKKSSSLFKNAKTVLLERTGLNFIMHDYEYFFHFIPKVEELDISWNNLWQIRDDTFSRNKNLKSLVMHSNLFDDLPTAITNIRKLRSLDARWNILDKINKTMRNYFENQRKKMGSFKLSLKGNVFLCICDTSDFIEWLHTTEVEFDQPMEKYRCMLNNGSVTTTMKVYKNFERHFGSCNSVVWLRIGIGLLTAFVVVVIPLGIVLNFRWQISYWIYNKFKRVVERGMKKRFHYDIYVSYSTDSASWVKNILVPKTERSWGLKMCIEDRDLLIGDIQADAIANSIEQSRHVIFVITDGFSQSRWGRFEIERAKYEKYTNYLQKIIVITKEVSVENFPLQLGQIWQDFVLINWNGDQNENGWDKLRMALFSERI